MNGLALSLFSKSPRVLVGIFCSALLLSCSSGPQKKESLLSVEAWGGYLAKNESQTAPDWMERVRQLYSSGDFAASKILMEQKRVENESEFPLWAEYLLFNLEMKMGFYSQAQTKALELLRRNPYHPLHYHQMGISSYWLNQVEKARGFFNKALKFKAKNPEVYYYLSLLGPGSTSKDVYSRYGTLAQKEYQRVIEQNPQNLEARLGLIELLCNKVNPLPELEEMFKAAIEIAEKGENLSLSSGLYLHAYIPLQKAIYYSHRGNYGESNQLLVHVLGKIPSESRSDLSKIYYYLGLNHSLLTQTQVAQNYWQLSVQYSPSGPFGQLSAKRISHGKTQLP